MPTSGVVLMRRLKVCALLREEPHDVEVSHRRCLVDGRIAPLVLLIRRRAALHKPPHHRQLTRPCSLEDGSVTVPVRLRDHLGAELLQYRLGFSQVTVCARAAELGILVVLFGVVVRREVGRRRGEVRGLWRLPNVLCVLVEQRN